MTRSCGSIHRSRPVGIGGVKEKAAAAAPEAWQRFEKEKHVWDWTQFEYGCASRAGKISDPLHQAARRRAGEQNLLEFARSENVIVTNLAAGSKVLSELGAGTAGAV